MPNFAYAVATLPVGVSGNVVAPTLAGTATILQFPATASGQAMQNLRGNTVAAAMRKAYPNEAVQGDVSVDANLASLIATGIGGGGTWPSPILPSAGFVHTSFSLSSTRGGTIVLNQYSDPAGALLVASTTAVMTANATSVLDNVSTVLMQSYGYVLTNTAVANAVVSSALALLAAK